MVNLQKLFEDMQQRFKAEAAKDIEAIFQYNLSNEQSFFSVIKNQQCTLEVGVHPLADIEFSMDPEVLLGIISGELDGLQAFMEGKVIAQGDVMLAPALATMFPS